MRKGLLFSLMLVVVMAGSYSLFSTHLSAQDTTFKSYLSGMMVAVAGGPGNNQLIRVNLHNRSLALYENGSLYTLSRIAAAGNPLDRTATPTGRFRILSKEKSHKSSLSGVIMPWAMRFYEGYFFHDIPLTPGGVIINTKYSHGCIRLPTSFVRQVFDWTKIGAQVEVYRADLVRDNASAMIYHLTEDGHRQPIANPEAFERNGYQWQNVVTVPSEEIAGLPLGQTIY